MRHGQLVRALAPYRTFCYNILKNLFWAVVISEVILLYVSSCHPVDSIQGASDGLLNSMQLSLDLHFGCISHLFSSKNLWKETNKPEKTLQITST
jgi:hypothetical protein